MSKLVGLLITAIVVMTMPAQAAPAAPDASATVDNVQKFYASVKSVTASFRQTVVNATFGSTNTSDGKVWLAKPGKMRWDYYDKKANNKVSVKKSFISNGKTLYVIEHDNKQVAKKNIEQDLMPVAVSFLYGTGDLKAEFDAALDSPSKYGGPGDIVLKMTPKPTKVSAQYKNLYLVVAPDNYRVKESVIVDSSDNVNQFMFFAPDFTTAPSDKWFEFDPASVKNYRVIDADAPQAKPGAAPTVPAPMPPPPVPAPAKP